MFILTDGPISFSSKKQSAIALSSTEVEYRGVVNAATQCLWLHGILEKFGMETETSTFIYCDNQSTIRISIDPILRQRTKHIEIHMHYIRGLVHDGVIDMQYCVSSEQVADSFTKMFSKRKFFILKSNIGIFDHVVNTYWRPYFIQFCSCPCLREDFPLVVFPLSLFCMDK